MGYLLQMEPLGHIPGMLVIDHRCRQYMLIPYNREMLRPNFARTQIGDLPTFEKHVQHLIAAVPRDGSTVNLSDLFFRLTSKQIDGQTPIDV
jgi:hypothetical protein